MRAVRFAKGIALLLSCAGLLFLSGCAETSAPSPLATLPSVRDIVPNADISFQQQQEERVVSLYYRMQGEDLLAREARSVALPKDTQLERVLIEALIEGPSASLLSLTGVFVPGTRLVALAWQDDVLFVTLSETFLSRPPDAPENWEKDETWRAEVLLRRKLALDAIVNTITDETSCTAVQLLVQDGPNDTHGKRILRRMLYASETNDTLLLGLVRRSEGVVLTHYHTANLILRSWEQRDWARLYRFVAQTGRPNFDLFAEQVTPKALTLLSFSLSPGHVAANGQSAVMSIQMALSEGDGTSTLLEAVPLHMVLEDSVWKIEYATLLKLLQSGI